jgi:transcriptional regulator with GAF, ATPase, and Fis domain
LDEIGDLPLEVQVRLLRVLQTKEFERVGGSEPAHSDFRLLVATNHDLAQEVKEGRFRSVDPLKFAHEKDDPTLKENERRHILWGLQKTGWKIRGLGGAAELLNIHPPTLAFRMKKLEIQRPPEYPRGRRRSKIT